MWCASLGVDRRIAGLTGSVVMKRLVRTHRMFAAAVAARLVVGEVAADDDSSWTAPALGPSGDGMTWG